jgi:hypothetical protein
VSLEFRTYLVADGYFNDPSLIVHGERLPGTLLTKVPIVGSMNLRFGMIVAIECTRIHVMWNPWTEDADVKYGELRRRLGIESSAERRKKIHKLKKKEAPT